MGTDSQIEWTHSTYNPWRGCTKIDPTCAKCYMFTAQRRYGLDPEVVTRCSRPVFNAPLSRKWAEKRAECIAEHGRHLVFTCSWSDFFHADADPWRDEAWEVIRQTPGSTYQILTSRPERILDHLPADWGDGYPNVWMGVTIGNRKFVDRADMLRAVPAALRFLSCEPLLGPLVFDGESIDYDEWGTRAIPRASVGRWLRGPPLDLVGIDWVIVGGESGGRPGRRLVDEAGVPIPRKLQWVRDLRDACLAIRGDCGAGCGTPCRSCSQTTGPRFFFKQFGGPRPGSSGRMLDGRTWDEMPVVAGEDALAGVPVA